MPKSKKKPAKPAKKTRSTSNKNISGLNKQIKHIGMICAIFAIFQALILIGLALTGIICTFIECGENTVAASFKYVYLDFNAKCPMTIVKPVVFFIFCIMYIILCVFWIIFSARMIQAFKAWRDVQSVKKAAKSWTIITIIILVIDVILYVLFLVDFYLIANNPDCTKFLFYSGFDTLNPSPINRAYIGGITPSSTRKTTIATSTTESSNDDNNLNPFLHDKAWDRSLWAKKLKNKYKNRSDSSFLQIETQEKALFPHLRRLNEGPAGAKSILPSMIGLLVAIKGVFAWMADVFLVALLRIKLATLSEPKAKKTIKDFLRNLNPFKKRPKSKPRKKECDKDKKKSKKPGKKSTKTPCACGKRLPKPKKQPARKKCE